MLKTTVEVTYKVQVPFANNLADTAFKWAINHYGSINSDPIRWWYTIERYTSSWSSICTFYFKNIDDFTEFSLIWS